MKSLTQLAAAIEGRMREFAAVDLGKTSDNYGDCAIASPSANAPWYPSLYVSDRKDAKLSEIPAKGKALIEYRLRSKSVNYAKDGTETHSSDIEVQSIDPQTHLEAILERHDFARGDQLASMIGAKVVPLREGGRLAADVAGRMKKVRGIDQVKSSALRGVLEPNKQKILKGMRGDLRAVKAGRNAAFNEARELWKGSIGTRLPNGALAEGRRAYGLEEILERYDFGDRARNPAGQYASGYDVSSDDMAAAYGSKKKKAAMIVGAGGATVAAALAGKKYAPQIGRSMGPAIGRVLRGALR